MPPRRPPARKASRAASSARKPSPKSSTGQRRAAAPRQARAWTPLPEEAAPRRGPALALLELGSVARGMLVADGMVKRAQVALLQAEPFTPGKFVIIVGGGEEEVAQSLSAGLELAGETIIDRLYLARADAQLAPALAGNLPAGPVAALGIVETFSVAACVLSADRAVKAAEVRLVRMRLARGLGGKAFYVLTGELHQVEAAIEAGRSIIHEGMLLTTEIIPRPHADLVRASLGPG